jgi:hypothetical protein
MTTLNSAQSTMLAKIVKATTAGQIAYIKEGKTLTQLCGLGLIEINPAMKEGDKVAARNTPLGLDAHDAAAKTDATDGNTAEPVTQGSNVMTSFTIETGVEMPAITRAGSRTSVYPFDALEVGQSFFVPATEEMPDPAKSLASTVSSASKRYATVDGTRTIHRKNKETGELEPVEVDNYVYERKFAVRKCDHEGTPGARVWRIEV